MEHYSKTQNICASAAKAGMDRKTAARYIHRGRHPEDARPARQWRTREDPFEWVWDEVEGWLLSNPRMQATHALEEILRLYPEQFNEGHLRSLQRRFGQWRREHGHGSRAVYFEQEHVAGRLLELDWFHPRDFVVTIAGERYTHLLCHVVFTFSNWEWAVPCRSESFASLKVALQAALWEAGGVPEVCQVDNSSTATHRLGRGKKKRAFNERFLGLLGYYQMRAQTIQVGAANENGDVESSHSHLRKYLVDALHLRASSDFQSMDAYGQWLEQMLRRRNQRRAGGFGQEKEALRALPSARLPEYEQSQCTVNKYSMVRVGKGSYSVPTKYIGRTLRAHVYESRIELWDAGECVASFSGHANRVGGCVQWEHLIGQLARKPGAFTRYRYRQWFYPSVLWRRVSESLHERFTVQRADSDYLQMLLLASEHGMEPLEELLGSLLSQKDLSLDRVRAELGLQQQWRSHGEAIIADLSPYDELLNNREVLNG